MKESLAELADLVRQETGMAAREPALRRAAARAAPGLGLAAFLRATSDPLHGPGLVDRLIDEVTIKETSFLRDRGQFEEIAWHSLLEAARAAGSGTIRVWSAGCASGEEAYTLAMLAAEAFVPRPAPVNVLGTDISGATLAAAQAGRYRERAIRPVGTQLRLRYFERQADGSYGVAAPLRALVRFRRHNLVRDPVPPLGETAFDLVVCRNVLIYLEAALAQRVIGLLEGSLSPGGVLVLGAADALHWPARHAPGRSAGPPQAAMPRRPLGRQPSPPREQRLGAALDAADRGDRDGALARVASLLTDSALDADAHFIHGLVALEAGEPVIAVAALRRALYLDAAFALAAFTLGRAYDTLGEAAAARRAYEQALRTLDPEDHRHEPILQQVDIGDIAAACRARLGGVP